MKLERRHYIFIAQTIRGLRFPVAPEVHRQTVAYQFARALTNTNPRFRRDTFLTACGVELASEEKAA